MTIAQTQERAPAARHDSASPLQSAWSRVLPFAAVFLAACVVLFTQLGSYPLFNPDEALYAEPAREMLENGDFITTHLNYVVRFTKPPLVIWAQALGILAFGVNEFAVRFFPAVCGVLVVAFTYLFAERFVNRRAAVASALMLTTAPLFIGTAREAITDMPLTLFVSCALMGFFAAGNGAGRRWLWAAWLCVGLAVMTKGPVGVILPAGILFGYHLLKGDLKNALRTYEPLLGMPIVAAISLPWFIGEIAITKGAYFHQFIIHENFQRFTSVVDSHKGRWWYHLAAMTGGFFPWSVFLPQAIICGLPWLALRQAWKARSLVGVLTAFRPPDSSSSALTDEPDKGGRSTLWLFCFVWAAATLIFFSSSVSKLLTYTLPAFPAIALLVSLEFERIIRGRFTRAAVAPAVLLALVAGVTMAVLPVALVKLRDAPPELTQLLGSFAGFELFAALIAVILCVRSFYRAAFSTFCIATLSAYLFFGGKVLTMLSDRWEVPLTTMAAFAGASGEPVFVFDMRKPSVPFYTRRQIIQPGSNQQLSDLLNQAGSGYVLAKSKTVPVLQSIGCKIIREDGRFVLARFKGGPARRMAELTIPADALKLAN